MLYEVITANMAGMYAVYHGPEGLKTIASRIHRLAAITAAGLTAAGMRVANATFFDTITIDSGAQTDELIAAALAAGYNLRRVSAEQVGLSFDETHTRSYNFV